MAEPLALEFYIGLPREIPDERIAVVKTLSPVDWSDRHLLEVEAGASLRARHPPPLPPVPLLLLQP